MQKRLKSADFAIRTLHFVTFVIISKSEELEIIVYESDGCKSAFDLSPYFCSGDEKCLRDKNKRVWTVCKNGVCKKKAVFAYILSKPFVSELQSAVDAELDGVPALSDVVASFDVLKPEDGVVRVGDVACP